MEKIKRGYRYVLVLFDNFSEDGFGVPLIKKAAQNTTNEFSILNFISNRKLRQSETDDEKEVLKQFSQSC